MIQDTKKQVHALLKRGFSVESVSQETELSPAYVYQIANTHNLPTNAIPVPGGPKETKLLALLGMGIPVTVVAKEFRLTPTLVRQIQREAREHVLQS